MELPKNAVFSKNSGSLWKAPELACDNAADESAPPSDMAGDVTEPTDTPVFVAPWFDKLPVPVSEEISCCKLLESPGAGIDRATASEIPAATHRQIPPTTAGRRRLLRRDLRGGRDG